MNNADYTYDVLGIGNAIVDILSFTGDEFLALHGLPKGGMMLVDKAHSENLYRQVGQTTECSGGSAANTLAGLASLGAKTAFIGKVRDDQLGAIFTHDLRAAGVYFDCTPATQGAATANCVVLVTPDAQRSMATYLGACGQVSESDIDVTLVAESGILYIEGYLWDAEQAKSAIRKAIAAARQAGRQVALTLSDTFCVERHRAEFLQLIEQDVDILFSNEAEAQALYQTSSFDAACSNLRASCKLATVTRGAQGSVVLWPKGMETVATRPVATVVDTTGAGDLYASGFLFGLTRGWSFRQCAELGNQCAGEIIAQLGARSLKPLDRLVA